MRENTFIKIIAALMFLYVISMQMDFPSTKSSISELVEVVDSEIMMTYGSRSFANRTELGVIKVRLQNGNLVRIDVKDEPPPSIGSYVQIEIREHLLLGDSYRLYK